MSDGAEFRKAVIVVLTRDEVVSLRETVLGIENACCPADVARILLFMAPDATEACLGEAARLAAGSESIPVMAVREKGGALGKELQQLLWGQTDASHVIIWTADQDAPPEAVALLLKKAKENPAAVVKFARFLPGGGPPANKGAFVNQRDKAFARLVCWLYGSEQTDPNCGPLSFPLREYVRLNLREAFLGTFFESVLCFERLGTQFVEVPLRQHKRPEGKSNLSVFGKLRFFVPVVRLRLLPKHRILREGADEQA